MKSGSTSQNKNFTLANSRHSAFTLAEVLITLAIIGVVAALTIPTLISNYQKNQYVTQLKKNYNILSNGFRNAMANDGVTKLADTSLFRKIIPNGYGDYTYGDYSGFMQEFSKIFSTIASKASCGDDYNSCPFAPYKALHSSDSEASYFNSWELIGYTPTFTLKDGTTISIVYNGEYGGYMAIDVNGKKKPNVMGRDVFILSYDNNGSIRGFGHESGQYCDPNSGNCMDSWKDTDGSPWCCNLSGSYCAGYGCAARVMDEGWQMKY